MPSLRMGSCTSDSKWKRICAMTVVTALLIVVAALSEDLMFSSSSRASRSEPEVFPKCCRRDSSSACKALSAAAASPYASSALSSSSRAHVSAVDSFFNSSSSATTFQRAALSAYSASCTPRNFLSMSSFSSANCLLNLRMVSLSALHISASLMWCCILAMSSCCLLIRSPEPVVPRAPALLSEMSWAVCRNLWQSHSHQQSSSSSLHGSVSLQTSAKCVPFSLYLFSWKAWLTAFPNSSSLP
mmetsp:Transcript_86837/g.202108  ORF Transcript_86837/g.202108 Transcript_86837/m.202108 type:complete len:243 (-) Transcript_86837:558-1286(-)